MTPELFLEDLSLWRCVWQSTLLIVIGLAGGFLLRQRPARAFQVLLLAMVAAVVVPAMSLLVKHYELGAFVARPVELAPETEDVLPMPLPEVSVLPIEPQAPTGIIGMEKDPARPLAGSGGVQIPWRTVLLLGWLIATLALLVRLLIAFVNGLRLIRCAQPLASTPILQALAQAKTRLGISRDLQMRTSGEIRIPMVWCWSRTAVLLVPHNTDKNIDWTGIICHELAHWMRRDHISGLLAEIVTCILCWHPLAWLAKRRLIRLGEQACDDWVVAGQQPVENYARSLLNFQPQKQAAFVPAVVHSRKGIATRVHRILKDNRCNPRAGVKWAMVATVFALCLSIGIAIAQTQPAKPQTETQVQAKSNKTIHQAAADGDLEEVKRLIAAGADLNAADQKHKDKLPPLCVAAAEGHANIVKMLLEHGAEVDANDTHGYTALFYAIWNEDEPTVRTLTSGGANVNLKAEDDIAPIFYAVWQDQAGIVVALLDAGANAELEGLKGSEGSQEWLQWSPLQFALEIGNPRIVRPLANADRRVSPIHKAALKGDLSGLKELLGKGTDLNEKDGLGRTPLYYALAAGQGDVAKFLLDQGADTSLKTKMGRTLLHQASRAGLLEIVRMLLAKETNVNERNQTGSTALHIAAEMGKIDVAKLLIAKGADVNASDNRGRTPSLLARQRGHAEIVNILGRHGAKETLHEAAASGDLNEVKRLLFEGADIDEKNQIGDTPLHVAISGNHKAVVELLIEKGADIEAKCGRWGNTPLIWACARGRRDIAELLLAKGADIEAKHRDGWTPLLSAAYSGQTKVAELLISKGAKLTARSYINATALHLAVGRGHRDVVELLLKCGADIHARRRGHTPVVLAMGAGQDEMVRFLVEKGADHSPVHVAAYFGDIEKVRSYLAGGGDLYVRNPGGQTLLHMAICGNQMGIVEYLLGKGMDVNRQDNFGWSALHWACRMGRLQIVKELLARGADLNIRDSKGCIATYWAAHNNHHAITRLTLDRGADLNSKDHQHYTLLHVACYHGGVEMIEMLLARGADVNARIEANAAPRDGFTPLHMACSRGHVEAAKLLIAKGADINAETYYDGKTGLDFAKERGFLELAKVLREHGAKE